MTNYKTTLVSAKFWILVSLLCGVIAVSVLLSSRSQSVAATTWQQSDAALGHQPAYNDAIEELSLTLNKTGFVPAEVSPSGSQFLLSIDNRTDVKELVLKLSDKNGNAVRELRVPGGAGDWSELFDLKRGKYVLSEANHAAWSCTITIK